MVCISFCMLLFLSISLNVTFFLVIAFRKILFLFLIKIFILTLLGIIIANLVSFIFIKVQYQYNFIPIPPGVYFTNFLPVVNRIENYLYPSIVILLFSLSLPLIFMKYFKIVKK